MFEQHCNDDKVCKTPQIYCCCCFGYFCLSFLFLCSLPAIAELTQITDINIHFIFLKRLKVCLIYEFLLTCTKLKVKRDLGKNDCIYCIILWIGKELWPQGAKLGMLFLQWTLVLNLFECIHMMNCSIELCNIGLSAGPDLMFLIVE